MLADIEPYQLNSNSTSEEHNKRPVEQNPNQLISLYEVTNEMRKLKGLKPLKINSDLAHVHLITYMKRHLMVLIVLNLQRTH